MAPSATSGGLIPSRETDVETFATCIVDVIILKLDGVVGERRIPGPFVTNATRGILLCHDAGKPTMVNLKEHRLNVAAGSGDVQTSASGILFTDLGDLDAVGVSGVIVPTQLKIAAINQNIPSAVGVVLDPV